MKKKPTTTPTRITKAAARGRGPAVDELPEYLDVPEYAAVRRISHGLVYAMVRSGKVESVRCGRLIRIPRRAV